MPKRNLVSFKNSHYYVEVKEDESGLGIIIDVFDKKGEELIDTFTYWNDDLEN